MFLIFNEPIDEFGMPTEIVSRPHIFLLLSSYFNRFKYQSLNSKIYRSSRNEATLVNGCKHFGRICVTFVTNRSHFLLCINHRAWMRTPNPHQKFITITTSRLKYLYTKDRLDTCWYQQVPGTPTTVLPGKILVLDQDYVRDCGKHALQAKIF